MIKIDLYKFSSFLWRTAVKKQKRKHEIKILILPNLFKFLTKWEWKKSFKKMKIAIYEKN